MTNSTFQIVRRGLNRNKDIRFAEFDVQKLISLPWLLERATNDKLDKIRTK